MDRKQLLHVKSKDLVEGKPKLPTAEQIDYGELAINYAADNEKISLKNSSNSIVTISTDAQNDAKFIKQIDVVGKKTLEGGEIFNDYSNNIASGEYSHTEGCENKSTGDVSHSEGLRNIASNKAAHVEGIKNVSSGEGAHAEGGLTQAIGYVSHSEGSDTIANNYAEHASGQFNKSTISGNDSTKNWKGDDIATLFSIGNGTSDSDRKNAFEVKQDGTILIQKPNTSETIHLQDNLATIASTQTRVAEIDEVVSKSFNVINKACGFNSGMHYVPQHELISNATSLSEAIEIIANKANQTVTIDTVQTTGASETAIMSQKAVSDELSTVKSSIDTIDGVTSDTFDLYFNACGFTNGEIKYQTNAPLISGAQSIIGALEVLANSSAMKSDVDNAIKFASYIYSVNNVTTVTNLPTNKYLVIAEINSSTNADSLTLANNLEPMQELDIIIHNANTKPLTITLPSSSTYINLSGSNISIAANDYAEINVISDGNKNYIRFA